MPAPLPPLLRDRFKQYTLQPINFGSMCCFKDGSVQNDYQYFEFHSTLKHFASREWLSCRILIRLFSWRGRHLTFYKE